MTQPFHVALDLKNVRRVNLAAKPAASYSTPELVELPEGVYQVSMARAVRLADGRKNSMGVNDLLLAPEQILNRGIIVGKEGVSVVNEASEANVIWFVRLDTVCSR